MWKGMFPIFLYEVRKHLCMNSQATIFAGVVLYNISRDLNEEQPPLPSYITLKRFDKLMRNHLENTPTRDQNNMYIRDRVIAKCFS